MTPRKPVSPFRYSSELVLLDCWGKALDKFLPFASDDMAHEVPVNAEGNNTFGDIQFATVLARELKDCIPESAEKSAHQVLCKLQQWRRKFEMRGANLRKFEHYHRVSDMLEKEGVILGRCLPGERVSESDTMVLDVSDREGDEGKVDGKEQNAGDKNEDGSNCSGVTCVENEADKGTEDRQERDTAGRKRKGGGKTSRDSRCLVESNETDENSISRSKKRRIHRSEEAKKRRKRRKFLRRKERTRITRQSQLKIDSKRVKRTLRKPST